MRRHCFSLDVPATGRSSREKRPEAARRRGKDTTESTPPEPVDPLPHLEPVAAAGTPGPEREQTSAIAANLGGPKTTLIAPTAKNIDPHVPATAGTRISTEDRKPAAVIAVDTSWRVAGYVEQTTRARSSAAAGAGVTTRVPARGREVTAIVEIDPKALLIAPKRMVVKLGKATNAAANEASGGRRPI